MSDYLKSAVKLILIFLIVLIVVNEVVTVALAFYKTPGLAQDIANKSFRAYRTSSSALEFGKQEEARNAALEEATKEGAELTFWQMQGGTITLTIKVLPKHTLIVHRIEALKPYITVKATASSKESPFD